MTTALSVFRICKSISLVSIWVNRTCVEFYYDRRRQEMLGIQEIVSIKEYNATHKPFCNKCESYEWNHTISFKKGDKYLLCNGCVSFFKNIKNKEMAGIKDIEKVR